jgi:hypothetical protein
LDRFADAEIAERLRSACLSHEPRHHAGLDTAAQLIAVAAGIAASGVEERFAQYAYCALLRR